MPNKENGNRPTVLIRIIAISFASFHLYTGIFGILVPSLQRPIHLVFSGVLAFLIYKPSKKAAGTYWKWIDGLLAFLALLSFGYFVWRHDALSEWMVFVTPFGNEEFFFGIVSTILLLEATRRASGLPLMLVGVFFLIYSWVGGYLPGALQHAGFPWRDVMESLFFSLDGVFGIPIGVSATYIVIFIIFGSFYEKAGGGQAIIDLGKIIAGHTRGGPAKIAVLTSALFGSISGSGVANVYATGTFTIPMMKRFGYKPSFAGAVEACASTGGQIMPPVMGAAAFVMADLTGTIYLNIITAALIPAILYFFSVFLMVDFEAARLGIMGIPRKELPAVREVLRQLHLFIPLVVLVLTLVRGKSPILAGILAVASTVLVSWFNPENRLTPKRILDAMETAGCRTVMIGMGTALCGVVIGVVTLTGVGLNFVGLVISLSGDITLFSLLLVMMATIILGMGVPTTVAYIIVVSVVVPALRELGFETLPAHMFAFYFAVISLITPPVAVSSLAASEIAGAEFFETGLNACKVGVVSYVVPFVFIYYPVLLMEGRASDIIFASTSALFGVWLLSAGVYGWLMVNMNIMARLLLITGGMLLLKPGLYSDLIGLIPGLFVIVLALKKKATPKETYSPLADSGYIEPMNAEKK